MTDRWTKAQAEGDWEKARRQAFWTGLLDTLRRRSSELVPFEAVKTRLNIRGSRYRGLQHVPLAKIVGSEGRYSDFDRRFLPRQNQTKDRWQNIDIARYQDVPLPPVDLYKIGDVYFVKDGNHRVSVARQLGQSEIDAYVTEYEVDVPLDETLSMRDLLIKEEYSDFLEWTNLARLRPEQRIELSSLGGYLELIQHINTHRYYLGLERNTEVPAEDAVVSWYDNVYMPVIEAIRRGNVLQYFPGRKEADLYLWIMTHRHSLRELSGVDPGPETSVTDYTSLYGRRGILDMIGKTLHVLRDVALGVGETTPPSLELLDFLQWSRIDATCPDVNLRLSHPTDYARLKNHILNYHYYLGTREGRDVPLEETVSDWCKRLYSPLVAAIRQQQALAHFPGATEADLILWMADEMDHRRGEGLYLDPTAVVDRFVRRYGDTAKDGKSALATLLEAARRLVTG